MTNMRYAHINAQNDVIGVYNLTGEVVRPDYIQSETAEIGEHYNAGTGLFSKPQVIALATYTISNQQITVNGQPLQLFAGNFYCQPGDTIQLIGNISDSNGNTVTSLNFPVTVKLPLVKHVNGQPFADEIYLDVTLVNGVITATGKIQSSGDWKILIARCNEAIQRIGANWKLQHADITFLA